MNFWAKRHTQGIIMCLPFVAMFVIFIIYPVISTVAQSFSLEGDPFIYYRKLFAMPAFRSALLQMLAYTFASALLVILISYPVTFLIFMHVRKHRFIIHLFSSPYVMSMMSVSIIMILMFGGSYGIFYKILPLLGISASNWLDSPVTAFICVLFASVWRGTAYTMYSMLNSMSNLPEITYEAAMISGASNWDIFKYITFPQCLSRLIFVIPTTIISVMTAFEPFMVLYASGSQSGASSPVWLLYDIMSNGGSTGTGCAIATLIIVPVLLVCMPLRSISASGGRRHV